MLTSIIFVEGKASATILAAKSYFRNTSSAGGSGKGCFRNAEREAGRLALDGSGSASVEELLMISSRSVCIFRFFYLLGSRQH